MIPKEAASQGGLFHFAQAISGGASRAECSRLVATGVWLRLLHGIYLEAARWDALADDERHLTLCRARLMALGPGWRLARRSAALVHGLPMLGGFPELPQLVRDRTTSTDRASSRHERIATVPIRDGVLVRGAPATSAARTVVDVARGSGFRGGLVVADGALRAGLDPAELREVAQRCAGWPGGANAVRVAQFADGLAESPLESISRAAVRACGLPVPELQVELYLGDRFLGRVDAFWEEANLVGEADGKSKYTSLEVYHREKLREQALEALGMQVVRWDWRQAWAAGPEFAQVIRTGLERGARNRLDPRLRVVRVTVEELRERSRIATVRAALG